MLLVLRWGPCLKSLCLLCLLVFESVPWFGFESSRCSYLAQLYRQLDGKWSVVWESCKGPTVSHTPRIRSSEVVGTPLGVALWYGGYDDPSAFHRCPRRDTMVEAMYGPGVFLSGLFVLDVAATSPRWQRLDECGSHDDMPCPREGHTFTLVPNGPGDAEMGLLLLAGTDCLRKSRGLREAWWLPFL
mmetsp:Transcript_4851/g.10686  ORF Transcript_4851/g.10686 Transcript_4851/m.10686 type:complete len:187 (+) Transcript_4851:484-1044(+)